MPKLKAKFKTITKTISFLMIAVFAFLSYTYFSQAQIPNFVNYQGRLRDAGGSPIVVPTTIQFSLYNHITNGAPSDVPSQAGDLLWTETYDGSGGCAQITPGDDGIFAQLLGTCVSFPAYLDFTGEYYLGVKIGADAEASPRIPLATNPYSFTSKRLYTDGEDITITTVGTGNIVLNAIGDLLIHDTNDEIGTLGQVLSSTGSGVDWVDATTTPWDNDHDTGMQVEETADDDTIRFDTLGTQRAKIDNGGNILFSNLDPANLFNPGALTGLLFRNDKRALRIGEAGSNEWDDVNIGTGSFSTGQNNIVSGWYSSALGGNNNINDSYSIAMGRNNTITSSYSVTGGFQNTNSSRAGMVFGQTNAVSDNMAAAWGLDNIASEREATAWGRNTEANAPYATSWGRDTVASGEHSTVFGYQNTASNDYGLAFGFDNTASGRYATVWGGQNTASGQYSTAWGSHNTASGAHSTAIGYYSTASAENGTAIGDSLANSNYMTAIGRFNENVAGQNLTTWVDTDQLFVIGNGSGWQDANRSNAFTILKNGTITAPTFSIAEINTAGNTALTTKEYVDGAILAGGGNIYTADGQIVGGDRTVDLNGNSLNFENTNMLLEIGEDEWVQAVNDGAGISSELNQDASNISYRIYDGGVNSANGFSVRTDGVRLYGSPNNGVSRTEMLVADNLINLRSDDAAFQGAVYDADYSANYTNRSLVDKEYVDTHQGTMQQAADSSIAADGYVIYDTGAAFYEDDGGASVFTSKVGGYEMGFNEEATGSGFYVRSGTFNGADDGVLGFEDQRTTTRGLEYQGDYHAGFTNRSLVDKEYVDEQLMWEIIGDRIQPKNNSVRQIYVEEDSNSYTQFMVRNNNDIGNGAGAIIELKGSGADYTNNMYIGKYGGSFWIPELRDNGAVLTDKNLVIGTVSNTHEIHFVTGDSYTNLLPVVVADNEGFRYTSDLSATFVDRTLVDKEYVDNAILSGGNNIYSADGTLTGARTVTMNTNNLQFDSTGQNGLFIIDATNNRIGVGTTIPDYTLDVAGEMGIDRHIFHNGDSNTYMDFTDDRIRFYAGGRSMIDMQQDNNDMVFNEGSTQTDFRFEGGADENLLFLDGSADSIGIGTNAPAYKLEVSGAIMLEDMTAPIASAGHSGIYSNGGELYALDASGNSTKISPHNENGLWQYDSENLETGKTLTVEMELLTKELNKILGGGYITEDGEKIDEGINIISNLSLKTNENINTISELQDSLDNNLKTIENSLEELELNIEANSQTEQTEQIQGNTEAITTNTTNLTTLSENINSLTELTTTLTETIDNHETRITAIEAILEEGGIDLDNDKVGSKVELPGALKTFADSLEVLEKDGKDVKFTLDGKLVVEEIKTGKITTDEIIIINKDVAGKSTISKGEDKIRVEFNNEFKIEPYVTAVVNNEYVLFKITDISKKGFTIKIKENAEKDIKFTWQTIVVEGKE